MIEYATHVPAKDVEKYLEAYAKKFALFDHIRFSKVVTRVERDEKAKKWILHVKGNNQAGPDAFAAESHSFDRLVMATGILSRKVVPEVKGVEKFQGRVIHSQDLKDVSHFREKNVVVVGVGATGADTTSFLKRAKAQNVYLSHRAQFILVRFPIILSLLNTWL
jgi:dimethylaniline monooxygenase (N-oxide forming)